MAHLLLSRMQPPEICSSGSTSSSPVDMTPTLGRGTTGASATPTVAKSPICHRQTDRATGRQG